MPVSLGEVLPRRISEKLGVTRFAVGGVGKHPKMTDFVHAADFGLQKGNHPPEIGLDDRRTFLLIRCNESRRLAGMQHVGDLLDEHVRPLLASVPAFGVS